MCCVGLIATDFMLIFISAILLIRLEQHLHPNVTFKLFTSQTTSIELSFHDKIIVWKTSSDLGLKSNLHKLLKQGVVIIK